MYSSHNFIYFYRIISTEKEEEIVRVANFLLQAFKCRNDLLHD